MHTQLRLGDVTVKVLRKDIKNIHLSVHPPTGRVTISAPVRVSLDSIRVFAISKLSWIRQQQQKFQEQERETPREFIDRESHYIWGKRYLLKVVAGTASPSIELDHQRMVFRVPLGWKVAQKRDFVETWYRQQLREALPPLVAKWQRLMAVRAERFYVRRMKTKWGSCNPRSRNIRLNTDLAKKSPDCLEYVLVHELAHLLERTHNARFSALMDQFMPKWEFYRDKLNRLPVRHDHWLY